jgi:hypothetical protein
MDLEKRIQLFNSYVVFCAKCINEDIEHWHEINIGEISKRLKKIIEEMSVSIPPEFSGKVCEYFSEAGELGRLKKLFDLMLDETLTPIPGKFIENIPLSSSEIEKLNIAWAPFVVIDPNLKIFNLGQTETSKNLWNDIHGDFFKPVTR